MRGAAVLALVALVAPAARAAAPGAPVSPPPPVGAARLEGAFLLAGRITVADNVPGERRGQSFLRTWTFTPTCPAGACPNIVLVRPRALGTDTLTLHRSRPGYYSGRGEFYAPLRCGSRTYARGAAVPFTITVTVATATLTPTGAVLAARINATYENRARTNLTPCVAVLGHDAARYHGHRLVVP